MFYGIAIVVIILDQLSKIWIRMNVAIGESFQFWNSPILITHYENSGAHLVPFKAMGGGLFHLQFLWCFS